MKRHVFEKLARELTIPQMSEIVCRELLNPALPSHSLLSTHPPDRASSNELYVYRIGHVSTDCVEDDWSNDGWTWISNSSDIISKVPPALLKKIGQDNELRVFKWRIIDGEKKVRSQAPMANSPSLHVIALNLPLFLCSSVCSPRFSGRPTKVELPPTISALHCNSVCFCVLFWRPLPQTGPNPEDIQICFVCCHTAPEQPRSSIPHKH